MDHQIAELLLHHRQVLTTATATRMGINRERLRAAVRAHQLTRVHRGVYAGRTVLEAATPEQRHLIRARALLAGLPDGLALSHTTAGLAWGLPVLGRVPARVQLIRRESGEHRRTACYTIHSAHRGVRFVAKDGLPLVEPVFAWLGMAEAGLEAAVVAGDAALRRGLMTPRLAGIEVEAWHGRRGCPVAVAALPLLDGASESVGESRCRLLLLRLGYPVDCQVEVSGSRKPFRARVDFMLRSHAVVVEFDGMVKYDGANSREALVAEKIREDFLRSLGYEVVRLVWADLADPDRVRDLIEAACRRAARR